MNFKKFLVLTSGWDADAVSILVANLIPIFGVAFYHWSIFSILFLYWLEGAIIGIFSILKMLFVPAFPNDFDLSKNYRDRWIKFIKIFFKVISIPFFMLHYGGFMFGHLAFIYFVSFAPYIFSHEGSFPPGIGLPSGFLLSFLILFANHGFSFVKNFIMKKEYKKTSLMPLMAAPYQRVIIMHLTLLFGSGIMMLGTFALQSFHAGEKITNILPVLVISLFVILKIFVDINAHNKEHTKLAKIEI